MPPRDAPTARFRRVALFEGVSLLVLLLVAMPLKYLAGVPLAVRVVGWVHGVLFIWYAAEVADLAMRRLWNGRAVVIAMIAASLPLGTFVLDRRLRRAEAAGASGA